MADVRTYGTLETYDAAPDNEPRGETDLVALGVGLNLIVALLMLGVVILSLRRH